MKYSSALQQTYFHEFYNTERTRSYLDNLNLLYVALTRARQGLIVTAPHPEARSAKKSVAQLLHAGIQQTYALSPDWSDANLELNLGQWNSLTADNTDSNSGAVALQKYASTRWRDKLVIRHTAANLFDPANAKNEKINYGIHIHTVLSRITYASEVPETLDRLRLEGVISREEQLALDLQLKELLANPQIASWFSPTWDVRTEIPILVPKGGESRIDRLLLDKRKAVIVDFKTGEPTKADQKQVQEYMDTLHKMNYAEVEGYLLYIKTSEVVSVSPGR